MRHTNYQVQFYLFTCANKYIVYISAKWSKEFTWLYTNPIEGKLFKTFQEKSINGNLLKRKINLSIYIHKMHLYISQALWSSNQFTPPFPIIRRPQRFGNTQTLLTVISKSSHGLIACLILLRTISYVMCLYTICWGVFGSTSSPLLVSALNVGGECPVSMYRFWWLHLSIWCIVSGYLGVRGHVIVIIRHEFRLFTTAFHSILIQCSF